MIKLHENITRASFIRSLSIKIDQEKANSVIERRPVILEKEISPDNVPLFRKILNHLIELNDIMDTTSDTFDRCLKNDPVKMEPITTLLKYEHIRKGLSDYF